MNSKQRVLTALDHRQPDRVPFDYLGTPEVSEMLKRHFDTDMDGLLERLGIDLRVIKPIYEGPSDLETWIDGRFINMWGHVRKPKKIGAITYLEPDRDRYTEFNGVDEVSEFRWPQVSWFDYSTIAEQCEKYSDYAIVYGSPGNMDMSNGTSFLIGDERFYYGIMDKDKVTLACMEKRFESCYKITEGVLQGAKGKVDILWIGDDYGSQKALRFSPAIIRELFIPGLKEMCKLGHKYDAKVMLHSCGSTREIWPDLIDAGLDIYDTIQPEAAGMDPAGLKEDFGDQICFHGTISTQQTLPKGTAENVAEEVRRRIETVGIGGGLILAPCHNIQLDTPLKNILALYSADREY